MPPRGRAAARPLLAAAIDDASAGQWASRARVFVVAGQPRRLAQLVGRLSVARGVTIAGHGFSVDRRSAAAAGHVDVAVVHVAGHGLAAEPLYPLDVAGAVILKPASEAGWPMARAWLQAGRVRGLAILDEDTEAERLAEAIQLVRSGGFVCELDGVRATVLSLGSVASVGREAPVERLSDREAQVLELVAEGLSNKEIGLRLGVSEGTIKSHVSHVMGKLRLANRSQAVAYALAIGFGQRR